MKRKHKGDFFNSPCTVKKTHVDEPALGSNLPLPDPDGFRQDEAPALPLKEIRSFAPSPAPSDYSPVIMPEPSGFTSLPRMAPPSRYVRNGFGLIPAHHPEKPIDAHATPVKEPKAVF